MKNKNFLDLTVTEEDEKKLYQEASKSQIVPRTAAILSKIKMIISEDLNLIIEKQSTGTLDREDFKRLHEHSKSIINLHSIETKSIQAMKLGELSDGQIRELLKTHIGSKGYLTETTEDE